MGDRQSWRGAAACSELTYAEADKLFFIGQGQTAKAGREFCRTQCAVRLQCLEFALIYEEKGIWGGTTDVERAEYPDYLIEQLRQRELMTVGLESRDTSDFIDRQALIGQAENLIPTQREPLPSEQFDSLYGLDFPEPEEEPLEVQLAVLDHLFEQTNALLNSLL